MKLYTKTVCPKCMLVKSQLAANEVEYEVINIDENEEAKETVVSQGFMAVPILENEGKFFGTVPEIQGEIQRVADQS